MTSHHTLTLAPHPHPTAPPSPSNNLQVCLYPVHALGREAHFDTSEAPTAFAADPPHAAHFDRVAGTPALVGVGGKLKVRVRLQVKVKG